MKKIIAFIFISFSFLAIAHTTLKNNSTATNNTDCDSIPEMNQQIVSFVESKMKKKVGDGECWALAAEALKLVDASWNGKYVFGKEVQYDTDCIYPGDIIQFERVTLKYQKGNQIFTQKYPHHTSIIYKVNGVGDYVLAHQNINGKKKVITGSLRIADIKKGKYTIYRPVK